MLSRGAVVGDPAKVGPTRSTPLAADGCETAYLHIFDIDDLDHIALIGSEVVPQVA